MHNKQDQFSTIFSAAVQKLMNGFDHLPNFETETNWDSIEKILTQTAKKLQDNYPYHHPLYAGQMLKPPHVVAHLAYSLAMLINPNNHALDGGKASSEMEKDGVAQISKMMGWKQHLGHLTSGGTFANLEALWIAGQIHPGKLIVASEMAHYTHERISAVLKIPFLKIRVNSLGLMDLNHLEEVLKTYNVGTVIATIGTTGMGIVDPLPEIIGLQQKYGFRIHADAAYGGYFRLASALKPETQAKYEFLEKVDSIVIDPHKHGLQPYGCGCVIFKDISVGKYYKHDSPYTYFTSNDLHLGEISLECSRPGASAVALWATMQLLPLEKGGEFAQNLDKSILAANWLHSKIDADPRFISIHSPELDIVVWMPKAATTSEISSLSQQLFRKTAEKDLHLALFNYPTNLLKKLKTEIKLDTEFVVCLRSCLMKPEHFDWKEKIWEVICTEIQDELKA